MYGNSANKKLFDSLIDSFNKYNSQLSEIGTKNMQNFAKLFSESALLNNKNLLDHEAVKSLSSEQLAKVNAFVQENIADFTKLSEMSGQINQEYKDLIMKVVDFYVQLYPSQDTYNIAENFKKVIVDSVSVNKDYGNLFRDFMKTFTTNFSSQK